MNRIRVLHAITMLELGGAQRNTLDTVRLLDRDRFELGLAFGVGGELDGEAREMPRTALYELPSLQREVNPAADAMALAQLRLAIRTFRPDIVHTHSSKAGILGRLAAHLEKAPVVVHSIHGYGFGAHQVAPVRWVFLAAERLVARWTHRFVAVSRRNLEEGVLLGLFTRDDAVVIRSGIDLEDFRRRPGGEAVRRELGLAADTPLVVQVACFKAQKAPERFLEMAAALAPRFPDAHFLLVGDGALRGRLEGMRRAAGLDGRLHLPGWRRDVPEVLAAATVVTLTSRFEGLPRVVVEARASGAPVVAMAVDGVAEAIADEKNGLLVREGDVASLTEGVARLLASSELRARLGGAAREGLDEFERATMIRQQEELYGELLEGRRG